MIFCLHYGATTRMLALAGIAQIYTFAQLTNYSQPGLNASTSVIAACYNNWLSTSSSNESRHNWSGATVCIQVDHLTARSLNISMFSYICAVSIHLHIGKMLDLRNNVSISIFKVLDVEVKKRPTTLCACGFAKAQGLMCWRSICHVTSKEREWCTS